MEISEFRQAIRSEKIPYRQIRSFGAMLASESGLGTEGLTIVGGSALEIYTEGDYVSDDVDLVAEDRVRVTGVLRAWGFQKKGMYWVSREFRPLVQIVGKYDSGSLSHTQIVSTPYGRVRLCAIEDIIVKRLIEARHWNRRKAVAEAMLAAERYGPKLDWEYVQLHAKKGGVEDLAKDLQRRSARS